MDDFFPKQQHSRTPSRVQTLVEMGGGGAHTAAAAACVTELGRKTETWKSGTCLFDR